MHSEAIPDFSCRCLVSLMISWILIFFFTFSTAIAAGRVLPGRKKDFWDRNRAYDGEREITAQSNLHTALVVEEFVRYHS